MLNGFRDEIDSHCKGDLRRSNLCFKLCIHMAKDIIKDYQHVFSIFLPQYFLTSDNTSNIKYV